MCRPCTQTNAKPSNGFDSRVGKQPATALGSRRAHTRPRRVPSKQGGVESVSPKLSSSAHDFMISEHWHSFSLRRCIQGARSTLQRLLAPLEAPARDRADTEKHRKLYPCFCPTTSIQNQCTASQRYVFDINNAANTSSSSQRHTSYTVVAALLLM